MGKTNIEWTQDAAGNGSTWNPLRHPDGRHDCVHASVECAICYADVMTHRYTGRQYAAEGGTANVVLHYRTLEEPRRMKAPRAIFPCSMTDLFGAWVGAEHQDKILDMAAEVDRHTYLFLTKRPKLMAEAIDRFLARHQRTTMPEHMWFGASVGGERWAWRMAELSRIPALRWLSMEPLIQHPDRGGMESLAARFVHFGINWVVAGGESGAGARPTPTRWARLVRDACAHVEMPFFFKQWGSWIPAGQRLEDGGMSGEVYQHARKAIWDQSDWLQPGEDGGTNYSLWLGGHARAGALLDGREHKARPQFEHEKRAVLL